MLRRRKRKGKIRKILKWTAIVSCTHANTIVWNDKCRVKCWMWWAGRNQTKTYKDKCSSSDGDKSVDKKSLSLTIAVRCTSHGQRRFHLVSQSPPNVETTYTLFLDLALSDEFSRPPTKAFFSLHASFLSHLKRSRALCIISCPLVLAVEK